MLRLLAVTLFLGLCACDGLEATASACSALKRRRMGRCCS